MKLREQNTALILIDIQKAFDDEEYWGGNRNNKDAEVKCSQILQKWRALELPIFHVVHSSQDPHSLLHASHPGFAIKEEALPTENEPVIVKNVNSAFIGTNLEEILREQGINKIVIVGLTTNHCVSTSTRMAGNLGFDTILISDATATFDRKGLDGETISSKIIHDTSLASLNEEFAQVMSMGKLFEII